MVLARMNQAGVADAGLLLKGGLISVSTPGHGSRLTDFAKDQHLRNSLSATDMQNCGAHYVLYVCLLHGM